MQPLSNDDMMYRNDNISSDICINQINHLRQQENTLSLNPVKKNGRPLNVETFHSPSTRKSSIIGSSSNSKSSPSSPLITSHHPIRNSILEDTEIKKVITLSLQLTDEVKRLKLKVSEKVIENQALERENQFLHDELANSRDQSSVLKAKKTQYKYERDNFKAELGISREKLLHYIKEKENQKEEKDSEPSESIGDKGVTSVRKTKNQNSKNMNTENEKNWMATAELRNKYQTACDNLDEMSARTERGDQHIKELSEQNKLLELRLANARENEKALLDHVDYTEQLYYEARENVDKLTNTVTKIKREYDRIVHGIGWGNKGNSEISDESISSSNDSTPREFIDLEPADDLLNLENDELSQLRVENIKLRNEMDELQRILDQTREDLQILRIQAMESPRTPRVGTPRNRIVTEEKSQTISAMSSNNNNADVVDSKIVEEWNKLLADKFEHNLEILKEQVIGYERKSFNTNFKSNNKQTRSFLEDYFRLMILSVKILLSKEPRYQNTVWYKIWCDVNSDEIYSTILNHQIPVEEWWLFLYTTIQTRLEYAKLEYEDDEASTPFDLS